MTPPRDRLTLALRSALGAMLCASSWTLHAQALDCLIQPNQVVQVGAPVAGVLETLDAERGDLVRRGQVVARLESAVERANAQLARVRAEQSAEFQAAERNREFARRERDRARELVDEQFVSKAAADKAETEAKVSEDRLQQAIERRRQAEQELRLAEAQLARREVRAPIAGIVVDRFLSAGELVEERPILRIAEVHPLRVEVVVPAAGFGQVRVGHRATVRPDAGPVPEAAGTVTIVDKVLDPASNTFRVRLSLPNPDLRIPAGARCKVDLGVDLQAAAGGRARPAAPVAEPPLPGPM
ncbi:MAG: efflux RND transporter periplasmic adaptor subunit, partial [Burkholderiales bacterium]